MGVKVRIFFQTMALLNHAFVKFLLPLNFLQKFVVGRWDLGIKKLFVIGELGCNVSTVCLSLFLQRIGIFLNIGETLLIEQWMLEQRNPINSLLLFEGKHFFDKANHFWGNIENSIIFRILNLPSADEILLRWRLLKWVLVIDHPVQNNPQRINIATRTILFFQNDLWSGCNHRTNMFFELILFTLDNLTSQPEISNF